MVEQKRQGIMSLSEFEDCMKNASIPSSIEEAGEAAAELMKENMLAIDLEGNKQGRSGGLSCIQFSSASKDYLFNINDLGLKVFELFLNEILENPNILKIYWDCRNDMETLVHICKAHPTNYADMQLAYIMKKENWADLQNTGKMIALPALARTITDTGIFSQDLIAAREEARKKFKFGKDLDLNVVNDLVYALSDTYAILSIYNKINLSADKMRELKIYTEKYAKVLYEKPERGYGKFDQNGMMPLGVFDEWDTTMKLMCTGCKRLLSSTQHFSKNQKKNTFTAKCKVCIAVNTPSPFSKLF